MAGSMALSVGSLRCRNLSAVGGRLDFDLLRQAQQIEFCKLSGVALPPKR